MLDAPYPARYAPRNLTCVSKGAVIQVRILFVEDSQDDVELLLAGLRSSGLAVEWLRVASEGELREALASSEWQVALVDHNLPGFSGLEALRILAHAAPDLPAITVSGTISEETAVATITAGAVDFVLKDNLTRLAPAVKRALESAELRRMQWNAAEQARQSKFAVDHASQAIVYVSEDGVILYANGAAGRLAGIAPEAAIGKDIWTWYPSLSHEDWSRLWHAAIQGPVEDVDALLRRADGSERAVSITLDHMERDEGDFVIAYAHDVTESKRVQADLSFTKFVVEHAGDPVFWMEAEGAFKYANPAACEALGYTLDEFLALSIQDIDPKYSSHWAQHISELKQAGSLTFETHHRRRDGTLVPVEVTAAYLEYEGVAYDVGFARDITERKQAAAELRESEERLRFLIDQTPTVNWTVDRDLHFTASRGGGLKVLGLELEQVVGMYVGDYLGAPSAQADLGVAMHERALADETFIYEQPVGELTFDIILGPLRDASEAIVGVIGVGYDATERKAAEEALRRNQLRYETFINATDDMAFLKDDELRYVIVNEANAAYFGRSVEESVGRTDADLMPPAAADRCRRSDMDALESHGMAFSHEEVDGRIYETRKFPVALADDRVGVGGYVRDITDSKLAEAALRESEAHYRSLFDSTDSVMLLIDGENGAIVDANPAACAWYGWSREEMLAMHIGQINTLPEPDLQEEIENAVTRTSGAFFFKHRLSDGAVRDVEVFSTPLEVAGRSLLYSMVHDITERRQAEQLLRDSLFREAAITDGVIAALSRSGEVRDPYTAGHERRVSELAVAIAGQLGLDEDHMRRVQVAGMLHDVGKVIVPAEILSRPGRLSAMEFALIKGHPQAAYDILESIAFDFPLAQIVVQHHERLDGSGYPQGLSGEEIMQEARILAVADVVEAMSSHRPYRAALGMGLALGEIRENAGVKYDAEVAAACLRVVEEQGFTFAD